MCRNLLIIWAGCLLVGVGPAFAVEYFPSDPGPSFHYSGGATVTISSSGSDFARISTWPPGIGDSWGYKVLAEGDILLRSFGYFAYNAPDPEMHRFDPPLLYLDFPLEIGKSWFSSSYQSGTYAADDSLTLFVSVIGPKQVAVPAGEFEVTEVSFYYHYHTDESQRRNETLWLHRQLGPVNGLESWQGVVANEIRSWGSVKALFR